MGLTEHFHLARFAFAVECIDAPVRGDNLRCARVQGSTLQVALRIAAVAAYLRSAGSFGSGGRRLALLGVDEHSALGRLAEAPRVVAVVLRQRARVGLRRARRIAIHAGGDMVACAIPASRAPATAGLRDAVAAVTVELSAVLG